MDVAVIVELELRRLSELLTAPGRRECLSCYLDRMLAEFGCSGHRFTRRWARSRLRGSEDGLVRWAADRGGCCCDCEVVLNSLSGPGARRRGGVLCAAALRRVEDEDALPGSCSGVTGGR